jgi:hypothetical protein
MNEPWQSILSAKVERIKPDPDIIALTHKVLEQNETILKMNARLLECLTSPSFLIEK